MGFLKKIHLVIKYKKGITNKFADMLSKPPMTKISAMGAAIVKLVPFTHEMYGEEYSKDAGFEEVYQQLYTNSTIDLEEKVDFQVEYAMHPIGQKKSAHQNGTYIKSCRTFWNG
jgi:hypothetical protein